jgi:alpha-beta hydrolase superfamily lysophospholipase
MNTIETFVSSKVDGLDLSVLTVIPENPVGIFQISHGMAEHKERYKPFLDFLAGHGWIGVIHDHRGHGKSVKSEEDYGHFYSEDVMAAVKDLHQISEWIKIQYPHLPLVLFGHSMGSLISLNYLRLYDEDLSGLILCGLPAQNDGASAGEKLVHAIARIKGNHHRSHLVQKAAVDVFDRKAGTKNNAWISVNPDNVQAYNADPACGFVFTLNGFAHLFGLMKNAYSTENWVKKNPNLPILFVAGLDDPVIESTDAWLASQNFVKGQGYSQISKIGYEGLRHEILLEREGETVMEDIVHFLETNITKS